jgi:hypothetical protein
MNRKKHCERVKMQIVFRSGNTAFLLDSFGKAAIKQGRSKEEVESVLKDCLSGDYNHVLTVLMDHTK